MWRLESLGSSQQTHSALSSLLLRESWNVHFAAIHNTLDSMIPEDLPLVRQSASQIDLDADGPLAAVQVLHIVAYLLSNKLPTRSNALHNFEQPKLHGLYRHLHAFCRMRSPTAQSIAESIFPLAVVAGDIALVKSLLEVGLDLNFRRCWHPATQEYMTPLQAAYLSRHTELAHEFIRRGSKIDNLDATFYSGSMVLAVLAYNRYWSCDVDYSSEIQYDQTNELIGILDAMIISGANVDDLLLSKEGEPGFLFCQHHSPLAAAVAHHNGRLVTYLLQKGASVNVLYQNGYTPLYAWFSPETHSRTQTVKRTDVLITLLEAGADVNAVRHKPSYLELAAEEPPDVFKLFLHYGATITAPVWSRVLECKDDSTGTRFDLLWKYTLDDWSRDLTDGAINAVALKWYSLSQQTGENILRSISLEKQTYSAKLLLAAIRHNASDLIDILLDQNLAENVLTLSPEFCETIESCCYTGQINGLIQFQSRASVGYSLIAQPGIPSICNAILGQKYDLANELLSEGADINAFTTEKGTTALIAAIRMRNETLAVELIGRGALVHHGIICSDCSPEYDSRSDAFIEAIHWGNESVILACLDASTNLNLLGSVGSPSNCRCQTPLERAIQSDNWMLVESLLLRGASPNRLPHLKFNLHHRSPLETAAYFGCLKTEGRSAQARSRVVAGFKMLLQAGADPRDETALCAAVPDLEMMTILLQAIEAYKWSHKLECPNIGHLPFLRALVNGWLDQILLLLEHPIVQLEAWPWDPLLCWAIEMNKPEVVEVLLQHGVNPNKVPDSADTPLQLAATKGRKDIIDLLMRYGADVNAPPSKWRGGATALQKAAVHGYLGLAYTFIIHDADVNAPPGKWDGRTALEGAAEHGRLDMVQMLLNAGADIGEGGHGQYEHALKRAGKNGHLAVKRLLEEHHSRYSEQ